MQFNSFYAQCIVSQILTAITFRIYNVNRDSSGNCVWWSLPSFRLAFDDLISDEATLFRRRMLMLPIPRARNARVVTLFVVKPQPSVRQSFESVMANSVSFIVRCLRCVRSQFAQIYVDLRVKFLFRSLSWCMRSAIVAMKLPETYSDKKFSRACCAYQMQCDSGFDKKKS